MTKGKKCIVCNEGKMKRNYIRSYWKGLKFTDEHILGIEVRKGKYNPQGWLCEYCGIFIPDKDNYIMFLNWNKRKENQENLLNDLKEQIIRLEKELNEYQEKYIYTKKDFQIKRKFILHRCYKYNSENGTYNYLKGLKTGYKQQNKFYKEQIKNMKLTDAKILKKAELINAKRKLGYT